ncbi:AMP-binding protein [Mycolicibacterium sp.]|uniref:AMP-binding protein n=1 Tax=Mycolicibacterium sp. TaxID=2320850 RepID=UPI001A1CF274|nr:AMP-binding protein [Mycolicibacterium sp.]MBJ7336080.1 AMP-binding protein [Mycolicibacterium sp.]
MSTSYDRGDAEPGLLTHTIGQALSRAAGQWPHGEALVDVPAGRRWTYSQLRRDVRRLASGLLAAGLQKGDRVGVWSPNRWEWTVVQFATAEIGVVLVTINPSYRAHELEFVIKQADIRWVFAAQRFKDSNYARILDDAAASCPGLETVALFGTDEFAGLFAESGDDQAIDAVAATLSATDPINVQYTSGTTGRPKGATLSHRNILNNGYFVGELLSYTDADRVCIPVPFYHCFGMVMGNLACLTHGSVMVIPAPSFDPAATLAAVQAEACTSLYGVPTMFIAELALEEFDSFDLSSLRTGIMAGSPCPEQIMRQVVSRMHMEQVSICYGMTETSPVSTQTRTDDPIGLRVGTVGRVGPHLEIKIVDAETGDAVERGVIGELCTRGYNVMLGYWDEPERTAEVLDADGWMHTGDLAVMDDAGYVQITGRSKDMVIRGGENIYPREVEEFLYTHPDVRDAQVVGVPDEKYGEELMAWIVLRDGAAALSADDVRAFAADKLARQKIPRYVRIIDELPMTVTGKIRKVELREMAVQLLSVTHSAPRLYDRSTDTSNDARSER